MIKLEDLLNVKMDLDALKEGCLSPYKEIYFLKFVSFGELPLEIYKYISSHGTKECIDLVSNIEGAKDLQKTRPEIWQALKDTVFSP